LEETVKNLNIQLRFVSFLFTLLAWTAAYGQLTPSGDSYTNTADPNTNYGAATLLYVGGATEIAYVQFNLSSIPVGYTGADITQATLKLYVNAVTTAGSFNVDYVNGTWSESTITANLAPTLGTMIAASVPVTTADKNQYILINLTPALQAWLNGSQPNDGIALVASGTFNASFDSKENTTTSHPSELDIVFAGIAGVTTATGSGLTGGGTSGTLNLSLTNTCATNQMLQWNGSSWACASPGTGTITGVTAGTDLTGGGTSGNVTLNLNTANVPQLAAANTFTGNQTVNGNLSATGVVTGSSFQIGGNLFAFGSYTSENAFLGFAGNSTMTGGGNTASGVGAFNSNTTGGANTANGYVALFSNTTGDSNLASGVQALYFNTVGSNNTAVGNVALFSNVSGGGNAASGFAALYSNTTGSGNTASGNAALYSNTTANYNAAIGAGALQSNTTGGSNTASGAYALNSNTTGSGNTAGGYGALFSNTVGVNNTASGFEALYYNTGNYDTATGYSALQSNTTGAANTASGEGALFSNTTGSSNTASGVNALYANATGSYNTALGYNAGPDQNSTGLTNATAIGANSVVSESNALVLGGTVGNGYAVNVGIGTATPAYTLDVHGTGNFTGAVAFGAPVTFAPGQTFAGAGTITGVTAGTGLIGGGSSGNVTLGLASNTCASGSALSALPFTCSPFATSGANTFTGNQTVNGNLSATGIVTGSSFQIGSNLFASGSYTNNNAFLGFAGNGSAPTGTSNTAIGYQSLHSTTGGANTAIGVFVLYSNTTGNYNTANGIEALESNTAGSYNTASGNQSLLANTNGNYNTASGNQSLSSNTTGSENTASGYLALESNSTGSDLTCIGYDCNAAEDGLSNATAIGAHAVVGASNTLVLGGTGKYAVKVGIGTVTPSNILTIAQGTGHPLSDGWDTFSSRRWKTNIQTLHGALAKVELLRGVSYDLKATGKHEVGVIAEEVGAVVPEVVSYEENGKDARGVDYSRLTALLIEATKEQQKEFRQQQAELAKALHQIKQQQSLLRAQSTAMRGLEAQVREDRETLRQAKAQVAASQLTVVAAK
jgi:hypothetical protein